MINRRTQWLAVARLKYASVHMVVNRAHQSQSAANAMQLSMTGAAKIIKCFVRGWRQGHRESVAVYPYITSRGGRSFAYAGPSNWNSLPAYLRDSQ